MANHYVTRGVWRDASPADVRRAYRTLVLQHHPDRNPGDPDAAARFHAIQTAYDVLSDARARAAHDAQLGAAPPPPPAPEPAPAVTTETRGVTQRAGVSFGLAAVAAGLAALGVTDARETVTPIGGVSGVIVAELALAFVLAVVAWVAANDERRVLHHARFVYGTSMRRYASQVPLPSPWSERLLVVVLGVARPTAIASLLVLFLLFSTT